MGARKKAPKIGPVKKKRKAPAAGVVVVKAEEGGGGDDKAPKIGKVARVVLVKAEGGRGGNDKAPKVGKAAAAVVVKAEGGGRGDNKIRAAGPPCVPTVSTKPAQTGGKREKFEETHVGQDLYDDLFTLKPRSKSKSKPEPLPMPKPGQDLEDDHFILKPTSKSKPKPLPEPRPLPDHVVQVSSRASVRIATRKSGKVKTTEEGQEPGRPPKLEPSEPKPRSKTESKKKITATQEPLVTAIAVTAPVAAVSTSGPVSLRIQDDDFDLADSPKAKASIRMATKKSRNVETTKGRKLGRPPKSEPSKRKPRANTERKKKITATQMEPLVTAIAVPDTTAAVSTSGQFQDDDLDDSDIDDNGASPVLSGFNECNGVLTLNSQEVIAGKLSGSTFLNHVMTINSEEMKKLNLTDGVSDGISFLMKAAGNYEKLHRTLSQAWQTSIHATSYMKCHQNKYQLLQSLLTNAENRLRDKELACQALTKKLQEAEDAFKIEWKLCTDEVLARTTQEKAELQNFFYNQNFEARLEANKLDYEKSLTAFEKDRNSLSRLNQKLGEDRDNLKAVLASQKEANKQLDIKLLAERKRVAFLLSALKTNGILMEQWPSFMGGDVINAKQEYADVMEVEEVEDSEDYPWVEVPETVEMVIKQEDANLLEEKVEDFERPGLEVAVTVEDTNLLEEKFEDPERPGLEVSVTVEDANLLEEKVEDFERPGLEVAVTVEDTNLLEEKVEDPERPLEVEDANLLEEKVEDSERPDLEVAVVTVEDVNLLEEKVEDSEGPGLEVTVTVEDANLLEEKVEDSEGPGLEVTVTVEDANLLEEKVEDSERPGLEVTVTVEDDLAISSSESEDEAENPDDLAEDEPNDSADADKGEEKDLKTSRDDESASAIESSNYGTDDDVSDGDPLGAPPTIDNMSLSSSDEDTETMPKTSSQMKIANPTLTKDAEKVIEQFSTSSSIKAHLSKGLEDIVPVSSFGNCEKKKLELFQLEQKQQKQDENVGGNCNSMKKGTTNSGSISPITSTTVTPTVECINLTISPVLGNTGSASASSVQSNAVRSSIPTTVTTATTKAKPTPDAGAGLYSSTLKKRLSHYSHSQTTSEDLKKKRKLEAIFGPSFGPTMPFRGSGGPVRKLRTTMNKRNPQPKSTPITPVGNQDTIGEEMRQRRMAKSNAGSAPPQLQGQVIPSTSAAIIPPVIPSLQPPLSQQPADYLQAQIISLFANAISSSSNASQMLTNLFVQTMGCAPPPVIQQVAPASTLNSQVEMQQPARGSANQLPPAQPKRRFLPPNKSTITIPRKESEEPEAKRHKPDNPEMGHSSSNISKSEGVDEQDGGAAAYFDSPLSPTAEQQHGENLDKGLGLDGQISHSDWIGAAEQKEVMHQAFRAIEDLLNETEFELKDNWAGLVNRPNSSAMILTNLHELTLAIAFFEAVSCCSQTKSAVEDKSVIIPAGVNKRTSQLLIILENLKGSLHLKQLPQLCYNYFVDEIIPSREQIFKNVQHLQNVGQAYGLLVDKYQISGGLQNLLFKCLYWRPPEAQVLILAILKVNSTYFNQFDFNDTAVYSLRERITGYCLLHFQKKYDSSQLVELKRMLKMGLQWKVPDLTHSELFPAVMNELLAMESGESLKQCTEIFVLLCTFWGPEVFPHVRDALKSVTKLWVEKKVSDGVYAAMLRSIGDMTDSSLENFTPDQLQPLRDYMDAMGGYDEEIEVVRDAMAHSVHKLAAAVDPNRKKLPPLQALFPVLSRSTSRASRGRNQGRHSGGGRGGGGHFQGPGPSQAQHQVHNVPSANKKKKKKKKFKKKAKKGAPLERNDPTPPPPCGIFGDVAYLRQPPNQGTMMD